jgi:hypothetical protein
MLPTILACEKICLEMVGDRCNTSRFWQYDSLIGKNMLVAGHVEGKDLCVKMKVICHMIRNTIAPLSAKGSLLFYFQAQLEESLLKKGTEKQLYWLPELEAGTVYMNRMPEDLVGREIMLQKITD